MLKSFSQRRRTAVGIALALLVGAALQFTNTNPAVSQAVSLTAYEAPSDPGIDPDADVWGRVSGVKIPLSAQTGAYVAGGTVQTISAKTVHYGGRIYVRVTWPDSTQDDSTTKVEDFSDAVALEFPSNATATTPALCMGQADAAVNIWHWRADSNAGLRDPIDAYVNAQVDGYPSDENLFFTAREAGNPYANPDQSAVQTLQSRAFGELTALSSQNVAGFGKHSSEGWSVVFTREFDTGRTGHAVFAPSTKTDMAFAVWDGNQDERNGRKAVSQFVTLNIAAAPAFEEQGGRMGIVLFAAALMLGMAVIGIGLATYGYREGRR